jgi:hypothetical protein
MIKIHYRYLSEGRKAFTPPAGTVGVDRGLFDLAAPTQAGALALVGAIHLGKTLSVWAAEPTDAARAAAKAEMTAKLVVVSAMTGWDSSKVKLQDA